jgi:hypothetical protein
MVWRLVAGGFVAGFGGGDLHLDFDGGCFGVFWLGRIRLCGFGF